MTVLRTRAGAVGFCLRLTISLDERVCRRPYVHGSRRQFTISNVGRIGGGQVSIPGEISWVHDASRPRVATIAAPVAII
jgi:hypothetical protein